MIIQVLQIECNCSWKPKLSLDEWLLLSVNVKEIIFGTQNRVPAKTASLRGGASCSIKPESLLLSKACRTSSLGQFLFYTHFNYICIFHNLFQLRRVVLVHTFLIVIEWYFYPDRWNIWTDHLLCSTKRTKNWIYFDCVFHNTEDMMFFSVKKRQIKCFLGKLPHIAYRKLFFIYDTVVLWMIFVALCLVVNIFDLQRLGNLLLLRVLRQVFCWKLYRLSAYQWEIFFLTISTIVYKNGVQSLSFLGNMMIQLRLKNCWENATLSTTRYLSWSLLRVIYKKFLWRLCYKKITNTFISSREGKHVKCKENRNNLKWANWILGCATGLKVSRSNFDGYLAAKNCLLNWLQILYVENPRLDVFIWYQKLKQYTVKPWKECVVRVTYNGTFDVLPNFPFDTVDKR